MMAFQLVVAFVIGLSLASGAIAQSQTPSDESIERLLEITGARASLEEGHQTLETTLAAAIRRATYGPTPTPEEREVIERMQGKLADLFRKNFNWERVKPMYVKAYKETFGQDEIDALIGFHATPAGKSVMRKMPDFEARTSLETRRSLVPLRGRMQAIQQDALRELKEVQKKASVQPEKPL